MYNCNRLKPTLALASVLFVAPAWSLQAEEDGPNTRDFLADESRVGSLAGTLIGGALTAHPAGTVVGAVVGYVVGKKSDFTPDEGDRAEEASLAEDVAPAPSAPVNPLTACFGDRGMSATAQVPIKEEGETLVSLVEFQPISGSAVPLQVASAGAPVVDNRRRVISPCYYYSSW